MSYDLRVWAVRSPELATVLPAPASWVLHAEEFVREGRTWQLVVAGPSRVEPEDVPEEVGCAIPGIGFLTELSVEPASAPKSALALAARTARAIAKAPRGVVADPQDDTVSAPAGIKRFVPAKRPDRFSLIEMSWWFTDGPLLAREGLDAFVDCLARYLPDALPVRYGLYELPQHRLAETGIDHFREFLRDNTGGDRPGLVWYPRRPVLHCTVRREHDWGIGRRGFECGYCLISVERSALLQAGWQEALRAFWIRASRLVRPFYGDVRTLGGFIPAGATYASDMQTESQPIRGPFWRGVPRDAGHACVAGPEYLELWPGLRDAARTEGELGFVTTDDWTRSDSVAAVTGPVPADIALRWTPAWTQHEHGGWSMSWTTEYPARWPFGDPPPPDRY